MTDRPRTAPPRPKSPRLGSPARPPPPGRRRYPAFGCLRPPVRCSCLRPAAAPKCALAYGAAAGREGGRQRGAPRSGGILARPLVAGAFRSTRLRRLPPFSRRRRHRGSARIPPLGWLRPGGRGGAEQGRMPLRACLRTALGPPRPRLPRRRCPLSLSVCPRVSGSSVSHWRGAPSVHARAPPGRSPLRESGASHEAWASLASCCQSWSVHTLDAGHGLANCLGAWGRNGIQWEPRAGSRGLRDAFQRKPCLR